MCGCVGGTIRGDESPSVDNKVAGVLERTRISSSGEFTVIDSMSRRVSEHLGCHGEA
jgi:hypothetical protein